MATPVFSIKSYTFKGVDVTSLSMNDSGMMEGDAMSNGTPISFSSQNGSFNSQGFAFALQGGPNQINDFGQISTYQGIANVKTDLTTLVKIKGSSAELLINGENNTGGYVGFDVEKACMYMNGTLTMLNVPGATATLPTQQEPEAMASTSPFALNDLGQAVGIYETTMGEHGFLYSKGTYTSINAPGATFTEPTGINNLGEIVGFYIDSAGKDHGFLDIGGTLQTYDLQGSRVSNTEIMGINNRGQIYGTYDYSGVQTVFVGTPQH